MNFLLSVIGRPIPTKRAIRILATTALVTENGFVVCDPAAFLMPQLEKEANLLATGCGYVNGHLHLSSRQFPMYFPESSPRMLLMSHRFAVLPFDRLPAEHKEVFLKELPKDIEIPSANPEVLRNVLPWFEVFQENAVHPVRRPQPMSGMAITGSAA